MLTTHDLDEARAADHVVLMAGRVIAAGPPGEVLTRHNLETAYGLGALHDSSFDLVDDPTHAHERQRGRRASSKNHPHPE